jgi:hypothetical protein
LRNRLEFTVMRAFRVSFGAMLRALAWLVVLPLWAPLTATAQSDAPSPRRTSTLSWTRLPGAESCPTLPAMATQMDALTGRSVISSSSDAELVIEAYVEALPPSEEARFRATVHVSTREGEVLGERVIETRDATCEALRERASIAMVLMIDPEADLSGTPETTPEVVPATVEVEPPREPVVTPAPIANPHRITVDLGAGASLGVGPFVAPSGHLRVLFVPSGFVPFGIVGSLVPWSRAQVADAFVDFLNVLGGVTICPLFFRDDTASLELCGGVDVGGALAIAHAPSLALRERERLLVQLDIHAAGRITLIPHWLILHANASLYVPFRAEAWRLSGSDAAYYQPEPVAAMFGLGLSLDLPLSR